MKRTTAGGLAIVGVGLAVAFAPAVSRGQAPATQQLPPVTLDLRDAPVREAMEQLFKNAGVQYVIDPAVQGYISALNIREQPFRSALNLIVRTASPPLSYSVENGIYIVRPRRTDALGGVGGVPGDPGAGGYPSGGGAPSGISPDAGGGPGGVGAVADTRLDKISITYSDPADIAAVFGGGVLQIGAGRGNQGGQGGGFGGQGGGFGGQGGGFGGQGGGFGGQGGGFGGQGGGFGGGGFGGQGGGFGGGGFGGQGGGFGGQGGGFGGQGGGFGGRTF